MGAFEGRSPGKQETEILSGVLTVGRQVLADQVRLGFGFVPPSVPLAGAAVEA